MLDPLYIKMYQKNPTNELVIDIMRILYKIQADKQFNKIDKIMSEINIRRIDDVIISSIIRCIKPNAELLSQWNSFNAKVEKIKGDLNGLTLYKAVES